MYCPVTILPQFYETGQDPHSVEWEQIQTRFFTIIFPSESEIQAQRLVNLLDLTYGPTSSFLQTKPKKIPVVMHNRSVLSNGFVVWAPKRMEITNTPPQESGPHDWLEQLALHEYRHVVQLYKLNHGFTGFMKYPFGQAFTGAVAGYLPMWFLEGDATMNETALSRSGRGRVPAFNMEIKALLLNREKRYSYDKSYLGSYKHFVPDYYRYGYHMVSYARLQYGENTWADVLDNVARRPFTFAPFYFGLKRSTGLSKTKLYKETIDTLNYLWKNNLDNISLTNYQNITHGKKDYTSYRYPVLHNKKIIAFRSGIDDIARIVSIDSAGNEEILVTPGRINSNTLSSGGDHLVWTELVPDPRWKKRNFSEIRLFNINTNKTKRLSKRTRYFSPCLNSDGSMLVCIETDIENKSFLVFIETATGSVEKRVPAPGNTHLSYPSWYRDSSITVLSRDTSGESLLLFSPANPDWDTVIAPSFTDLSQPHAAKDHIYIRASYSGTDNIYAADPLSDSIYQVVSAPLGAFDPLMDENNNRLIYSHYTDNGYQLVSTDLDTSLWKPLENVKTYNTGWADQLTELSGFTIQDNKSADSIYPIEDYNRTKHLFKFHSWVPFYVNYEQSSLSDPEIKPGIMLFSQNLLGTAISNIAYAWDNGHHKIIPRFIYKGFYPVIDISADLGGEPYVFRHPEEVTLPADLPYYKELNVRSYIPLEYSFGKYSFYLQPSVNYEYNNAVYYKNGFHSGLTHFHYNLYAHGVLKTSKRDIVPRFGQTISFSFTHSPFNRSLFGSLYSASTKIYLPGLLSHHSIMLHGGIQMQQPEKYLYGIFHLSFPRGYTNLYAEQLYKLSGDYILPLWYPDLSIGPLAYIKRIRSSVFCDYTYGKNVYNDPGHEDILISRDYYSFGIELISDLHFVRFIFPFSLGIRTSFLPQKSTFVPELLFNINTSIF